MPYCDVWAENNNTEVGMYAQTFYFDANSAQNRVFWLIVRFIPTFSVFSIYLFRREFTYIRLYISYLQKYSKRVVPTSL